MRCSLVFLSILLASCRTPSSGSSVKQLTYGLNKPLVPPPCTQGESVTYMLQAADPTPVVTASDGLPPFRDGTVGFVAPDANRRIRFDLCVGDDATLSLAAVATKGIQAGKALIVPEAGAVIKGLDKVIFDQDYTALDITIPFNTKRFDSTGSLGQPEASTGRLIIKGLAAPGVAVVAEIDDIKVSGSPNKAARVTSNAAIGRIVAGNPETAVVCPNQGFEAPFAFTRGTARFSGTLCEYIGTSGTSPYQYAKIVVTDSNPLLPAAVRDQPQTLTGAELKAAVTQVIPHHNICEATQVKLPSATYIWRMFSGNGGFEGNCGAVPEIPDAPVGSASNFADPIVWKAKYGGDAWQEGVGGGHPLHPAAVGQ